MIINNSKFKKYFSDNSFWEKIKEAAVKSGLVIVEKALILYYCFKDSDTPLWARTAILGALGYFIFPLDFIPDFTPIGYTDDLLVLSTAFITVLAHIKEEHKTKALEKINKWFINNKVEL